MGFRTSQLEKLPPKEIQTFKDSIHTVYPGIENKHASESLVRIYF